MEELAHEKFSSHIVGFPFLYRMVLPLGKLGIHGGRRFVRSRWERIVQWRHDFRPYLVNLVCDYVYLSTHIAGDCGFSPDILTSSLSTRRLPVANLRWQHRGYLWSLSDQANNTRNDEAHAVFVSPLHFSYTFFLFSYSAFVEDKD